MLETEKLPLRQRDEQKHKQENRTRENNEPGLFTVERKVHPLSVTVSLLLVQTMSARNDI